MAQPTLANKLRLLQLTADQRQFVLDNGLTERHARAVSYTHLDVYKRQSPALCPPLS